jgi:hypothetical protein
VDSLPDSYPLLHTGSRAYDRVYGVFSMESDGGPFMKYVWFNVLLVKPGCMVILYGHA